ncbi:hypothetical protein QJS10_CPB20g00865 [Acorus calamus]|uniref:Serine aminopeptidase S33 domain-containing protein n=1 Tax=Acorus calamus TaxID=4465 RepID=A0AAV9CDZ3_ACOCL|nr:hypothetical protein QJS10_CPB20g00865 [Acorus calamus]
MKETMTRLAKAGYAVHGIDYEGHGKSSGLQAYIPSFDALIDDCLDHFTSICERVENKKKQRFLFGASMGGAVALLLHLKRPTFWNGAILVAPMCKIAEEIKPHPIVINILQMLCKIIPTWKIIPTKKDMVDIAIKMPEKRQEALANRYCYLGKLRLKTGNELLMVSLEVEKNLSKVSLPFLIIHGGDDMVINPSVSQSLYDSALSTDKTFKLYPGMWHALTFGESKENIDLVFSDIVSWLDNRATMIDSRSESEWKAKHDDDKFLLASSHD